MVKKKTIKNDVYCIDIERDKKRQFIFSDVIESKITQKAFNKYFTDEDNIITINRLPTKSKIVVMSSDAQCAEAFVLGLTIKDKLSTIWDEMYDKYIEEKLYKDA